MGIQDEFLEQEVSRNWGKAVKERSAIHDPLTGLHNRAALKDHMGTLLAGAETGTHERKYTNAPVTMLFSDLNRFKRINDEQGHIAGDTILKQYADALKKSTRSSDVVARYGGDEFIILMRGNPREAEVVARKIHDNFSQQTERHGVTPSIGIVGYQSGWGAEEFIKRGDAAMYLAKEKAHKTGQGATHVDE